MKIRILLAATIVAGALCAGYWSWQRPARLGETDLLLLGDIANESGEKNFDGSLREALRVALLQSPHLNLVSDEKIRNVLREMGQPDGAPLTEALAPSVCAKTGAQAYLTGKISQAGSGYLVKLGMSPLEAIEAATASGPLTIGPQAPRSGRLAEGYDADVITLDADPLADIGVLADPDRITAVWTRGRPVKGVTPAA